MKSVIQDEKVCYITGSTFGLHDHHVYGGSYHNASERYGLKIWLRADWHVGTNYCIHKDKHLRERIQREVQLKAMEIYHWTLEDWIEKIGRSFL